MTLSLYPWHQALWERVRERRAARQLPHALLLTGPVGIGKRRFAATLVQALCCERPHQEGYGCGACSGCYLQRAGSHPDNRLLLPREGKQVITIDQIRQVQTHLALKPRQANIKTVTIVPAEAMTLNAANSLLKVLEEPPGETLLILVASVPSRLPMTIRSRCQRLSFLPPEPKQVQSWLQDYFSATVDVDMATLLALTGGAPLRALEYVEQDLLTDRKRFLKDLFSLAEGEREALAVAQSWFKKELGEPLYWMAMLVGDMIRLKNRISTPYLLNRDMADPLQTLASRMDVKELFALLDKVNHDRWLWQGPTRVNPQLLLEGLLIYWTLCFNPLNR